MIEITSTLGPFLRALERAGNAVGFAKTVALTRTAKATATEFLPAEAQRSFDRPTRTTLNAFYYKPATARREEFIVGIKDQAPKGTPASRYLAPEILGGQRGQKRSERALTNYAPSAVRRALGNRGYWVPGPGAPRDAYGNVPGSFVVRVLSALRAQADPLQNATERSRKRRKVREEFFVLKPHGGGAPGIWVRRRGTILPVFLFVHATHYRQRFDFFGKGMAFAEQRFVIELERALAEGFGRPK